jgi:acetyl esterase/lipase
MGAEEILPPFLLERHTSPMKWPQKLLMNRRQVILASTMAALTPATHAAPVASADGPDSSTIELWPRGAPGADRVTVREEVIERLPEGPMRDRFVQHVTRPLLTLFAPRSAHNGITLLIVPGGGYVRVVIDKEGIEAAEWFTARGFAAAVLRYRLPADGWAAGADAPVHDAMRAMRLLRSRREPGASVPGRVGIIGFSAGGHLCARLTTEPKLTYPRQDAADEQSARPEFAVLMYPVIATAGAHAHSGSAQQLLAAGVSQADLARYSPNLHVSALTPPTMLVHAADDASVPVENSLLMYESLRKARVRSELHVFDSGGHGFGLRGVAGKDVAVWPTLVQNWAMSNASPAS